ncbi:hypothetical protein BGX21_001596 [Mortierella sp. AD011]|nr:hypothetical protein BGX20_000816 [Mortierella sp. AD010]KAF9383301.1 hypothetical protein BGX21_001596 [Mortierella sp. AD011]
MPLSFAPTDKHTQPFVLASPDRVLFRTLPHPLPSTNKRVTLSLKRSPAQNTLVTAEPSSAPLNSQSSNTYRHTTNMPPPITTPTTAAPTPSSNNNNNNTNSYPDRSAPQVITTPSTPITPVRKQSPPLLKNGLPLKSAMKTPPITTCTRLSPIRSQSSPCLSSLSSPKFVHFNSKLEHVRLFLQGEMPSCVADRETITDAGDNNVNTSDIKLKLINWNPVANGAFEPVNIDAGEAPLRVENVELSQDQTELIGTILVQNIDFHKHVSVRYTIDYWQTKSEVNAEYKESIPSSALDRFVFRIALDMEKSIVEKTFCFAVRYQVIGREFWDSNNGMNYQVECKRVVVSAPQPVSDLSKQMNSILLASQIQDYSKPVLKKKVGNSRYDLSSSLSAATRSTPVRYDGFPVSQTAYRPSEYITPIQSPPGYHTSLYASSPKFINPYMSAASPPEHFHVGFDQLTIESLSSKKDGREAEFSSGLYSSSPAKSSPINIPAGQHGATNPHVDSSSYYDLVDRYCFYKSSPHSSPYSSYSSSPSTPCIRG